MKPTRLTGAAAVSASAESAGTMASSKGSASAVPAPFKNVRRGMNRLVTSMGVSSLRCHPHAEWRALHDALNQGRDPVVVLRRVTQNLPDGRRVVIRHSASECVRHQLL